MQNTKMNPATSCLIPFSFLHLRRDFQTQRVEPDEAGGIVLVVAPAMRDRVGFHCGVHGLFKQRRQVSDTVQNSRDFNPTIKQTIENDVMTDHKAAQARR